MDLINFLLTHWFLSGSLILVIIIAIINEFSNRTYGLNSLSTRSLIEKMNHEKIVIFDLRSKEEYVSGHIVGALNIAPDNIMKQDLTVLKFKHKIIVLVCNTGSSAPKFGGLLFKAGFKDLSFLDGGMDAWKSSSLPLTKN